jgi:dihydrodipicolinate synthase/N-acetylneuraminate lyase
LKSKISNLKSQISNGVLPAMATPLAADGYHVNTAVLPELVQFLLDAGVKGLFVGGTTGEGILLDVEERMRLHEATIAAAAGRAPVIVHVGANRTDVAVTLARHARDVGADAIAAVTPYFYGVGDDGLVSYYQAITTAVPDMPMLLYDIPHLAMNGISPEALVRLGRELPTLAGIKTSRTDAQVVRRLLDAAPDHLIVLAGNESIALGLLALGAHGLISGLSTAVPEPFVALSRAFAGGQHDEARRLQGQINRMLALLPAGARIGALKSILAERGLPVGPAVPPRPTPTEPLWPQIRELMG